MKRSMNLGPGTSLVGKNLLPIALRFKNYDSSPSDAALKLNIDNEISEMDQSQLVNVYRHVTGESEKDICELAGKDISLENLKVLVHLTLEYAKEVKMAMDKEVLEELKGAADIPMEDVPVKKYKRSKPDRVFPPNMHNHRHDPFHSYYLEALDSWCKGGDQHGPDFSKFLEERNLPSRPSEEVLTETYQKNSKEALSHVADVKNLPVEDTIWLLDELCTFQDETGEMVTSLIVQDKRNLVVGCSTAKLNEAPLVEQCHNLIVISALNPLEGVPRKPRNVTCKQPSFAEKAAGLDLTDLGIKYMYAGVTSPEKSEYIRMRECCVCGRRGSRGLFKKCSSCQSMMYCSRKCQKEDWSITGDMAHYSHKLWCKKMKSYMSKTPELCTLPFTFSQETSSESFDVMQYKQFLEREGVYNTGFWRREARLPGLHGNCQCCVPYGEISACDDGIVLPVESTILSDSPVNEIHQNLSDWSSYYQYRGLRMDSPVAILLQWPLTIYFIVKYCLPNDYFEWWDGLDSSTLLIDMLGVEKEVEMLDLFKEVGYLLPDVSVDMVMYGAEISTKVNNKVYECGNVKIQVRQGLYHRKADPGRKPNVVIGFNAGLAAYKSWSQTLVRLRTDKTPAYFTDYCQYSCECGKRAVEKLGIGTIPEPTINPFRSPVRKLSSENDMPWFSNGFIMHLVYP